MQGMWRIGGFWMVLGGVGLTGGGCTDRTSGVADPDAARGFVDQLTGIPADMSAMKSASVALRIQELLADGQQLVAPADGKFTLDRVAISRLIGPFAGTGGCGAEACTLISYYATVPLEEVFRIDGSITRVANDTTFALQYSEDGKFAAARWDLDGRLTTRGTRLDGTFHGHGVAPDDVTWDFVIRVSQIVLDAQGCAIGGSLDGDVSYQDNRMHLPDDPSRSRSFDVSASVELGAGCGAAR